MDRSILPLKDLSFLTAPASKASGLVGSNVFKSTKDYGGYGLLSFFLMILTSLLLTATSTVFAQGNLGKAYQHWADATPVEWNNNILNDSKSNYFEGEVIPHVYVIQGSNSQPLVTGQTYQFTIIYNYYQQNTNAGGFAYITTFNESRPPGLLPNASGITPLADATDTDGNQGLFYTVNANVTSATVPVTSGSGTLDQTVTVSFIYTGTDPLGFVEIYYGLYIAEPDQVPVQGTGPTQGASSWSGGSLQTTVQSAFSGALSLQLAPAAIIRGEISGIKYNDLNKNGSRQENEVPLAGWTFYLDLNNNGQPDDGEPTDVSDSDGRFFFSVTPDSDKSDLDNDPYYVRELQNQEGWTITQPSSGVYGPILITIADPNETGLLFGNFICVSPVASGVATNASCSDGTGTATITATGGTAPYSYSRDGLIDSDGVFTGLGAGIFTFLATDANGCTDEVEVTISVPAVLAGSGQATNATCSDATGTATITGAGGTAPYTYFLTGAADADGVFTGLGADTYTFLVTDAKGCTDEVEVTISVPSGLTADAEPTAALCFGGTGTATVTATGGTAPYTYSRNGTNDADGIFTGLLANTYTFRVTDANGCFDDVTVVISQPAAALVARGKPTNATCSDATGTATITGAGGTAPYTYSLNGTADADGVFTGLGADTYTFLVTDANGCTNEVPVTISQPVFITCNIKQPLVLPAFNSTGNVLCATTSATAVSYKWSVSGMGWAITEGNTGAGTACIKYTTGNSGTSGTFQLTVTDINGCTTYCSVVITPPVPVSEGCTPGFWKNATNYWDKANDPVSKRIADALGSPYNGTAVTGSLFSETFGLTAAQMKAVKLNTSLTLKQAINLGGGDFQKLARHATAALLSASGLTKYSYSISQVLTMTRNAIISKKAEPTASLLAAANETGNCPISSSSKNPTILSDNEPVKIEILKEVEGIDDRLDLLVYPNPFVSEVNFRFTSPATGFATIEIFDVMGKKISVVFKGNVEADMEQTAQFNLPAYSARTMLMYRLTVGDKVISGKVLPQ